MDLPDVGDNVVAIDTEGSGLHVDDGARVSLVSLAWLEDDEVKSLALPFGQGDVGTLFGYADRGPWEWLELCEWLQQRQLVAHNAPHDILQLEAGTVTGYAGVDLLEQLVGDTMLNAWVLEPQADIGLDKVSERLFGVGKDQAINEWFKKSGKKRKPMARGGAKRYDLVPIDVIGGYASTDAELALRVWLTQQQWMKEGFEWAEPIIAHEMDVMRVLIKMMRRGIEFDRSAADWASKLAAEIEKDLGEALPFLATEDGARRFFYEIKGALPHCVTPGGKKSVAECCVRQLIAENIEGADDWATFQKVKRARSMWYDGYGQRCGADGRLRTDFKQAGVVSYRFASQRVNLQALPHDYKLDRLSALGLPNPRTMFIARDGYDLYELDLAQAELRIGAKYARCESMLAILEEGGDLHGETANRLFHVQPGDGDWKMYRQVAKRANFSFIFEVGPKTFMHDLEKQTGIRITLEESAEIVQLWRDLYPEFGKANRKATRMAESRGYVKLPGGRMRWFKPYEDLHKAFNQAVQGSLAQMFKVWMVSVDRRIPGTLVLVVHDSQVLEVPQTQRGLKMVEWAAQEGGRIGTEMFGTKMSVDVKKWAA